MAMGAVFIGWGPAVRGREQKALEVFQEAVQYWGRMQQQGEIQSFEPVALEPHGGDLNGFCLIKGDADKLARLRVSNEFIALNTRAQMVVENFGVAGAFVGEGLQALFADFGKQAAALG
ncbi:MAG: hypothetical protein JO352_31275 [Chloroflexi bacterium]|nr:hypothetical protein [Chloroflexota bacterium]MBV9603223.1 hypothetical protein [Chloroflexota bacterium]